MCSKSSPQPQHLLSPQSNLFLPPPLRKGTPVHRNSDDDEELIPASFLLVAVAVLRLPHLLSRSRMRRDVTPGAPAAADTRAQSSSSSDATSPGPRDGNNDNNASSPCAAGSDDEVEIRTKVRRIPGRHSFPDLFWGKL